MIYIDNQENANKTLWLILTIVLLDLILLTVFTLVEIDNVPAYIFITSLLIVFLIRAFTLKYTKIEIKQDMISIKFRYILLKGRKRKSVDIQWDRICFCQLEKILITHYIIIDILGEKKQSIYYNIGIIPKLDLNKINIYLTEKKYI